MRGKEWQENIMNLGKGEVGMMNTFLGKPMIINKIQEIIIKGLCLKL